MIRGVDLAESGRLPDALIRIGIRLNLRERLRELARGGCEAARERREQFDRECRSGPIALVPETANDQHYEVPAAFYEAVLGPHLKYSSGYWPAGCNDLAGSEAAMLALTCERARIEPGQRILDLGCGWGSLSLWIAEHFPTSEVVGVSNSKSQREHILGRAQQRSLDNLEILTADVNEFDAPGRFDRVVSVEMFEHVRNHEQLLGRIARWLADDGRLFVHHFSHRSESYPYEDRGDGDWMARHFFTGGMMPADGHLLSFQGDLRVERHWRVSGQHYARTSEAWLQELDAARAQVLPVLAETYGAADAERWFQRWRIFFLACAELFAFRGGNEWWVTHLRFRKQGPTSRATETA